ncbi:MAG: TRAP transporter substrate-binding protein, partial [Hyphomicrobiaceae bacterium]
RPGLVAGTTLLAATCLAPQPGLAEGPSDQSFKVVGSWSFNSQNKEVEKPFFTKTLPEASGGKIKIDYKSITELGLSGFEVVDLTRKGVYDMAFGSIGYIASKSPALEGVDLAGTMPDFDTMRKAVDAYRPVVAKEFASKYGVHLLTMSSYPSQQIFCNRPINKLEDLKNLKIRVHTASLGDFLKGIGAVPVTIPFGEVVPALQRGVADCGITGTLPAYDAKWREVVSNIYQAGLGWAIAFSAINKRRWDSLDKPTQEFLTRQFAAFEEKMFEGVKENNGQGFICNTGKGGKCRFGEPGHMTLVVPDAEDKAKMKDVTENYVLTTWAQRCGAACVKEWNETLGKAVGMTAKRK